jgi:hypothetical protein
MRYLLVLVLLTLSCSSKEKWQAPKGKDCDSYFAKDAIDQANKNKGIYTNRKRAIFVGDPSILLTNLLLNDNKLVFSANLINVKTEVCIKGFSPMGIKLENGDIYLFDGRQKPQCVKVENPKEDVGALGIFEMPINSVFMKNILIHKPKIISLEVDTGFARYEPLKDADSESLQNAFRCAFEALGDSYDLSDDSVLINNKLQNTDK